jgi:UDP-N-acetylmuramoyl-tripeptide--D-alanyl-D-alanine ligase
VYTLLLAAGLLLTTGFAGWRAWRRLRFFLHVFQLETYKLDRYTNWCRSSAMRPVAMGWSHALGALALTGGFLAYGIGAAWAAVGTLLAIWPLLFISSRRYRRNKEKKPLAFTDRMTRLATTAGMLIALIIGAGVGLGYAWDLPAAILGGITALYLADLGGPLWVALAALIMTPVENAIQEGFKRQARARLRELDHLHVVGITGSYGKTSTKHIVAELLGQSYNVLATPGSYNTPMGICIVVNEKLRPEHQVLVLEMGMRYPGDIAELCDIATPDASMVTTVGVAHLETMGSVAAIAEEKASIINHTAPGGPVVLNVDNEHVEAMAGRANGPVWRISAEGHPDADIAATNIRYSTNGLACTIRDEEGRAAVFETHLLGKHNVTNLLLAVALGRSMGMRLRAMAHAARRLQPVEHRLKLRTENGITIIDDAFNSNPVGARNAVDLLGEIEGGQRFIVTPGMVEMGAHEDTANYELGLHIAKSATDAVYLVGDAQTQALQRGLKEGGFPHDCIHVHDTLFDAQDTLSTRLQPGDIVLYENDLPDQYEPMTA